MQKFYHFMRAYHNVQKFIIKYTVKYIIKAIYNICTPLSTNFIKKIYSFSLGLSTGAVFLICVGVTP